MEKLYEKVLEIVDNMESDEENVERLHNAAQYFCSVGEMCDGYKGILINSVKEQYNKFPEDQEPEQWEELKRLLAAKLD